jgi:hypothetical protein
MKKIGTIAFCAAAFMLIAAPIFMEKQAPHQILIDGKPFAHAVLIGARLAVPVDEFSKAVGAANVRIQGNKLTILAPRLQASSSANANPTTVGSATGGAGSGKIRFNEFTIKKTADSASPIFSNSGRQFIWFEDVAKFFGMTQNVNGGTLAPGAPINLHVTPNPGAAIAVGDVNG